MYVGISDGISEPAAVSATNEGSKNAMRNASRASEVPKYRAVTITFAPPAILASAVNEPTVKRAPKIRQFTDFCDAVSAGFAMPKPA